MLAATLRALLSEVIDYAGLFPPASLSLEEAAANYAEYLRGPRAWMLGRFILPASRLDDLAALRGRESNGGTPWRLSVICGDRAADDARAVTALNAEGGVLRADSVEFRFSSLENAATLRQLLPQTVELYAEVPLEMDRAELAELNALNVRAKVRTGGVVESAFPSAGAIATFLSNATGTVPIKFTAGLHHPIRSRHNLTYAADAPAGTMHGFLNVFVAACFAHCGQPAAKQILLVENYQDFEFTDENMTFRQQTISLQDILNARMQLARSFGSCSFTEPLHDLTTLGLL